MLLLPILIALAFASPALAGNVDEFVNQYPAIESYKSMMAYTGGDVGKLNRWTHNKDFQHCDDTWLVTPSVDFVYSKAWLDLRNGPVVVKTPKHFDDRYFSVMFYDTDHFDIGTMINPQEGEYVLVKEGYAGALPKARRVITSATDFVFAFMRIAHMNQPLDTVFKMQQSTTIAGTTGKILPDSFASRTFTQAETNAGMDAIRMVLRAQTSSANLFGTRASLNNDYSRAGGVLIGQWGLPKEYVIYQSFFRNRINGKLFDGAKDYSLTFPAVVPTRSHWSITVYNSAKQLHCQKDRIHSANSFRGNQVRPDRTITIMFSASCEDKPYCTETPKDGWYAISRIYEPEQSVIDGTWMFPQIKELER